MIVERTSTRKSNRQPEEADAEAQTKIWLSHRPRQTTEKRGESSDVVLRGGKTWIFLKCSKCNVGNDENVFSAT